MSFFKRLFGRGGRGGEGGRPRDLPPDVLDAILSGKDKPRDHHYFFAHYALRDLFLGQPMRTLAVLSGERAAEMLADVWADVGGQLAPDDRVAPDGLGVAVSRREGAFAVAVVALPEPRYTTECFYVALFAGPLPPAGSEADFEKVMNETPGRFFTLEKGFVLPGAPPRTTFCEWADGAHHNMGDGPAPGDPEALIAHAMRMLR